MCATEHPHGEVLYGETVTCADGKHQITPCCLRDGRPKRIPLRSASQSLAADRSGSRMPSLTTQSSSTVRVLHSSVSMATTSKAPLWASPSQARAPRVMSLPPQLLAKRRPGDSALTRTVSPRHLIKCVSRPLTAKCNPGHPTVTSRAHAAASYTVSRGTSGQQSHTSQSCLQSFLRYCVLMGAAQGTPTVTADLSCTGAASSINISGTTQPENFFMASLDQERCVPRTLFGTTDNP